MSLEELSGVVLAYPWFGLARKALCLKLLESGGEELAQEQIKMAGMYLCSRGRLRAELERVKPDVNAKLNAPAIPESRKVVVVGGDFFSQEQYDKVGEESKLPFGKFKPAEKIVTSEAKEDYNQVLDGFCTEAMAEILINQGYVAEAKYIYSKLILRYPEKSAYFASQIDRMEKEN